MEEGFCFRLLLYLIQSILEHGEVFVICDRIVSSVKDTQNLDTLLFCFTSLTAISACLELELLLWFAYKLNFVFTLLIQLLIFSIMSSSPYSLHFAFVFWILTSVSLDILCSLAGISFLFSFFHSSTYPDSKIYFNFF